MDFIPETTRSGRRGKTRVPAWSATYTQSAGVPSIAKDALFHVSEPEHAWWSVSEWLVAL